MRRPDGFDAAPPPEPEKRPASKRSASKRTASKPQVSKPQLTERAPEAPRSTRAAPKAAARESDRAASKAAARARRERLRFERDERRRFTRRSRQRRAVWLGIGATVVVLAILLSVAVFSPLLSVRRIEVRGASQVDAAEVEAALGAQLGVPLALVDSDLVRRTLAEYPIIRSFAVELVPPSTMVVAILEREPVGVVVDGGAFQVVDPAGVRLGSSVTRPTGLPLIESASGERGFNAVVAVLLALPSEIRDRVELATAATRDDVRLLLRGSGAIVVWGSAEDAGLKARVLVELMRAQGDSARVEYDVSAPLVPVVRKR